MVVLSDSYVGHVLGNVHVAGSGPIWLDNVNCEDSCLADLNQCQHNAMGDHDCYHSEDVSIACYDRNKTDAKSTTTNTMPGKSLH